MTKQNLIRLILTLLLGAYLGVALVMSNRMQQQQMLQPPVVTVLQDPKSPQFITPRQLGTILQESGITLRQIPRSHAPLQQIENYLNSFDNIEHSNAWIDATGHIHISVTPMKPVARLFTPQGTFYINRDGKQLSATPRFRIDVPVVTGDFSRPSAPSPASLLPLLERIHSDSVWNPLTAQIHISPANGDILLLPIIRGQIINLGDTGALDSKLRRLEAFYRKVIPIKGWQYYDTISVKFGGQVVASRRLKPPVEPLIRFDHEGDETDEPDIDNMLTDSPVI